MLALIPMIFAGAGAAHAQEPETVRLSGYVRSAANDEVLRTARLEIVEPGLSIATNRFGYYSIELATGGYTIRVSRLGYETVTRDVNLEATTSADFALPLRPVSVAELTVETEHEPPDLDPGTVEMSVIRFDIPALSRLPVVLGEADPVRTLTLYPGITTTNDATTAINVRGGAGDENLILLDDSEVFNPAHAIGLLSSRLNLEGPLFDGNGSWLVAGRRTYADLFLGLASDPEVRESTAYFYDLNAKANARYGATGQVMVSGYFGRDRLKVGSVASVGWGNAAGTMRWNHGFGSIFSHVTLAFSDYDYHIQSGFNARAVSLDSRVRHLSLSVDESWTLGARDQLQFGAGIGRYDQRAGARLPAERGLASGDGGGGDLRVRDRAEHQLPAALLMAGRTAVRLAALSGCLFAAACERIVEVEIPAPPELRLVVEGRIALVKGAPGGTQRVRLTTTDAFFGNRPAPPAVGAGVTVTDGAGGVYPFVETERGHYVTNDLHARIGETYALSIDYEGDRYAASASLTPVAPIDSLYFIFEEETLVNDTAGYRAAIDYTDPPSGPDFYLWEQFVDGVNEPPPSSGNQFNLVSRDDLYDGQPVIGFEPNNEVVIEPGAHVMIRQVSLSRRGYDYYYALFEQNGLGTGNSFSVPPATIRGNVANTTRPEQYPFGFFGAAEVSVADGTGPER
ncbi:DUF4249 family protein [Candidatus Palauibacter sp.]|uniref:DUF4249 family protein n=1 Tax=Candidatus Palauibacter sp. TaxID=3101350 RepID=UPI003B528039